MAETRVYFFANEAARIVKVGISSNIDLRLRNIQTNCPYELEEWASQVGTPADERYLHGILSHKHMHGEWFVLDDESIAIILSFMNREVVN